ncbi:MAG: LicD family protein [Halarcobacter sp.]
MTKYNFTLEFKNGIFINLELINKWFDLFQIKTKAYDSKDLNEIFSNKILELFSSLMETINIPLFNVGKITQIIENETTLQINLSLNKIEYIPKDIYTQVLNISVNLIIDYFQKEITTETKKNVFDCVQSQLINPLNNISSSGKSTIPFLKVVFEKNIPFEHLANGIYQLGWGAKTRLFNRSIVDSDSAIGSQISQNKIATAQMLKYLGLPFSNHIVVTTEKEALEASKILTYPLVVKPSDKNRDEGVFIDIMDEKTFLKAFNEVLFLSINKQVIIEKQVLGVCHRVFIVKNRLLYAVKKLPIYIKGDGKKTISQLIDYENSLLENIPPWKRTFYYPKDKLTLEVLQSNNMDFETILEKGEIANLRKIESTQWGGIDEDVTSSVHQDNIEIAIKAARAFNLDVAGIDIISPDINKPWHENGAIINEINFSPLLGGGDISKKSIPTFIDTFFKDNGRIPISVFIGENSLDKVFEIQKNMFKSGNNVFVVSDEGCFNPDGSIYNINLKNHYAKCKALLADKRVESLIISSKIDPFFNGDLPIDKIDNLEFFSNTSNTWKNLGENILSEDYHNIINDFLQKSKDPFFYFNQGNCLKESGNFVYAKEAYLKTININSNLLEVYNNLAVTHLRLKDLPSAIKEYRKAVELLLKIDISKIPPQEIIKFDTKHFEPILYETLVLLAKNYIKAFPTSGTLLGLEREGGLLPFDKDIDIGLPFEQMNEATICLVKNGWEEIEDSFGLINPKAFLHKKSGLTLDIVGFKKDTNSKKVFGGLWVDGIADNQQRITEHNNMELKEIQYPCGLGWALKDSISWLVSIYGENWCIPDKGFDTVLEAKNIKSFSLLVQYYGYSKIILYFTQRKFDKLNRTISLFRDYFPDDTLFIKLQRYLKNEK